MKAYEQLKQSSPQLYDQLLNWVRFGECDSIVIHAAVNNDFQRVMCYIEQENLDTLVALAKTLCNYIPAVAWRAPNFAVWQYGRYMDPWPDWSFDKQF